MILKNGTINQDGKKDEGGGLQILFILEYQMRRLRSGTAGSADFLLFFRKNYNMPGIEVNDVNFKFQYLPDYATFLLNNKLEELTRVGIRFCREADLPMLRPLSHIIEEDLIAISMDGNKELLTALASNNVAPFLKNNIRKYINNQIVDNKGTKLLDRSEVLAEDIILAFYLRRKIFAFFLYAYTQNTVLHTLIIAEMDYYTTQEQMLTSMALIKKRNEEQENSK